MSDHKLRTENLLKLAWPIFLQHTTNSAVVLVDFWFFSFLSDETAGTVGQLLPIIWMGAFVIPVFAGTGVSVASQYMGAGQHEKVVPAYMMNLVFTSIMGAIYGGALWFLSDDIGRWMGMSEDLNIIASAYLGTMSVYFVFLGVLVAYNAVLSSRGMTHWLMYSSFMVAGINFVLDSLFVFGFGLGIRGIVYASVIAIIAATLLSLWLVHRRLGIHFRLQGAREAMRSVLRPMLRIGVSNALEPFCYTVQQTILSTMIIALGVTSMAANSYSGRAQMFQITFSVALALSAQILMAHWMGARRFQDVNRLYWKAIRSAMVVAAVYATSVWLFSDVVLGIFTDDPDVLALGRTLLFVAMFLEPARAVNIIGGFTLRTVGDARFPLVIAIVFIWGILPVVYVVKTVWGIGLVGLWMCFAADEIIRAGINLWRWRSGKWRAMGIAEPATPSAPDALATDTIPAGS